MFFLALNCLLDECAFLCSASVGVNSYLDIDRSGKTTSNILRLTIMKIIRIAKVIIHCMKIDHND